MKRITLAVVLVGSLAFINHAAADPYQPNAVISTFDNFASDQVYGSWAVAGATNSTPTNYIITASGVGSNYKYIGYPRINGTGCTNIQLDITLDGPAGADGKLGPYVELIDTNGNDYVYAWYGQSLGHHVLNMPIQSPTRTNALGTPAGLNLAALKDMHMGLDPSSFSGTYTSAWNNLRLFGPKFVSNLAVTNATITTFNNFVSGSLGGSWTSATIQSNQTSYLITATGYGYNYKYIGYPPIDGTGCTNLELDCYITGPTNANGQIGPIVELIDGDGTDYKYAWYGQTLGHHTLTIPLESPTLVVNAGGTPGLDVNNLLHMHMAVDPGSFGTSGAYTISWNNLRLTGGISDPGAQNLSVFADFSLDSRYVNWSSASIVTNTQGYQLTASGYGSGHKSLPFPIDASANTNLQLTVNLSGDAGASGSLGPIVTLTDASGTSLNYAWYGQPTGELVLNKPLSEGTPAVPGQPAFDFAHIASFGLQLDPGSFVGSYTVAWEQLDLTGYAPAPTPIQITSQSYNPLTHAFTLSWSSMAGKTYTILNSTSLTAGFATNTTGIASGGTNTTAIVTLPTASAGFLRVQQE